MAVIEELAPAVRAVPRSRLTPAVRRDVLLDKLAWNVSQSMVVTPPEAELERIHLELQMAHGLFERRGWLADPAAYHQAPELPQIRSKRVRSGPLRFTSLTWISGYEPHHDEPGRTRWNSYQRNHIARASILRHRGKDRPWLLCVHGWGMGRPALDAQAFRALHLHRRLGLNVALVVLPLHGKRRPDGATGMAPFPGVDMMDNVHGFAQATSDIRQLISWIRERTDAPIGLMGMSLGGYTTALVSSIDDRLDAAVPLIPAVDLTTIFADLADERLEGAEPDVRAETLELAGDVLSVVAPLHLTPQVDKDRRYIVAATLDQFTRASTQAAALWRHWDEPAIKWFHGSHVSLMWAKGVQDGIDRALRDFGLAKPLS